MTLEMIDQLMAEAGPRLGMTGPKPTAKPFKGQLPAPASAKPVNPVGAALVNQPAAPRPYQSPFGDFTDTGVGAGDDALEPMPRGAALLVQRKK